MIKPVDLWNKPDFAGITELSPPGDISMRTVKRFGTRLRNGRFIHGHGVKTPDEPEILRNGRMVPRQAVALLNDADPGVYDKRFRTDNLPDGRGRLDEFFLKNVDIRIPEDFESRLGAKGDTLGTPDAFLEIIDRIFIRWKDGGAGGTYLHAKTATVAAIGLQNGMGIRMHSLLLGPRSHPHRNIFNGPSEG